MPKIPTFKAEGTITAEAATTPISVQAPLSIARTLEPIQKAVTDYAIKEKVIQEKTEALRLENDSIIELNTAVQEASKMLNKEEANNFLKNESTRIRNKFRNQASSSGVQRIFDNNYLIEEQKQIFKVDNAVYKNIIQDHANQKSRKYESVMTEGLFGNNSLQEKELYNDLVRIENEDLTQDEDTRLNNIAMIPFKIDYFKSKREITNNPIQALRDLEAGKDGPYKNLTVESRTSLISEATLLAKNDIKDEASNHLARIEAGLESSINYKDVQKVLGSNFYENFIETETGILRTRDYKKQILNSEIGKENEIIKSFEIRPEASELDLRLRKQLQDVAQFKSELLKEDPASLVIQSNDLVKEYFNDFNQETNEELKAEKFKKYIDTVRQTQLDMGLYSDQIKVIPNSQASELVQDYNRIQDPREKINYLNSLEAQYGENYSTVLMQLSEQDLPMTAKLVSYFQDDRFALESFSIDSDEERKRLDDYLKGTDETMSTVTKQVSNELADFRSVVFQANPFDTSRANKEFDNIVEVMTYITINKMSASPSKDLSDAASEATEIIKANFDLKDTYFIPKMYNNKSLPQSQRDHIANKAKSILDNHIDDLDLMAFRSTNKSISDEDLNSKMLEQVRDNGLWLNKADGSGLFLAVKFSNGEYGEVLTKDSKRIEMNFDDGTFLVPGTNIKINDKKPGEELLEEDF